MGMCLVPWMKEMVVAVADQVNPRACPGPRNRSGASDLLTDRRGTHNGAPTAHRGARMFVVLASRCDAMRIGQAGSVLLGMILSLLNGRSVAAGELTIERVFGPEVPTGPYKHPACMTELKNGDLYL